MSFRELQLDLYNARIQDVSPRTAALPCRKPAPPPGTFSDIYRAVGNDKKRPVFWAAPILCESKCHGIKRREVLTKQRTCGHFRGLEIHPRGRRPRYPLARIWGGSQTRLGTCEKKKSLPLPESGAPILIPPTLWPRY